MLTLSAISLSLSLMMGAQSPMPLDMDSTTAVQCEEDMPCWDADSMGNGLSNTLASEAWATLDASQITFSPFTKSMSLTYTDTVTGRPTSLPSGYFALESNTSPNAFHIFKWDTLYFA